MICIIAEKPSVAREIAKLVGAGSNREGYKEGGGYLVTWCFGHLIQLAMPRQYGYNWDIESLPMLPKEFKLVVRQEKKGDIYVEDQGVKKQIEIIQSCIDRSKEIIVATDAAREGELIFRYLYDYLKYSRPFKRLWTSSLTDFALKEGLANAKDGRFYDNIYHAGRCRSHADWLVGMNGTQAYSVKLKGLYSIGRVQTPTLMMICERYLCNKAFVKVPFFKLIATCKKDNIIFKLESVNQWPGREGLPVITDKQGTIVKLEKKDETSKSPALYDLTGLQKESNKRLGYTAEETLNICQSLYEKKFISYPRTGSCYLTQDVYDELPKYTHSLPDNMKALLPPIYNKAVVNPEKVTDHHALLITEIKAGGLSQEEESVYNLICIRMVEALSNHAKGERINITMECGKELFVLTTIKYHEIGWRGVKPALKVADPAGENEKEKSEEEVILPTLAMGEKVAVTGIEAAARETKPLPVFTEETILAAMETAGRMIENREEREAIKDCGIGTQATRSTIIETLIFRNYIQRDKRKLIPTDKGLALYKLLQGKKIGKVEVTGHWEKKLNDMAVGKYNATRFMNEIEEFTREIVGEGLQADAGVTDHIGVLKEKCPRCGKGLKFVKNDKLDALVCTDDKSCKFIVWRKIAGKKLGDKDMLSLACEKKTRLIKGFKGKTGKEFEARLKLSDQGVVFDFQK